MKNNINPESANQTLENEDKNEQFESSNEENADENLEDEESTDDGDKKSGKFFKKKEKKKDPKDLKIEELEDRLKRTFAEFDNYRKRTEKEKSQMFEIGARDIVEKVLPVIDNFERGLGTLTEEEKSGGFAQGIEKIYKQLMDTLTESGLKPIEAAGKEFNPDLHNAVMHSEDPELGENIVAEEFQKGYIFKDTVVRHSMVRVVN
ncbi:nucleotide exchange factor GrpE [Anaerocolumna sp.]|uniref:nucleotide exchange factor GrpE n=1 Tax=Anaerocolumna sp. TaxID=2041569 RepID=UPI0028B0EA7A|nr:nucleotide exchange factor GrpE [Anaerocolumna sp.]